MAELQAAADRRVDGSRLSELLGVEVSAVDILEDTAGSANRLRLRLTYADPQPALPERMFLKRNLPVFGFPAEMYSTEIRVYREVLPALDIEHPLVFAIDATDDDSAFTLLMEDVSLRPGAKVGHVLDPASPDQVDSLLETLARLHTARWGDAPRWATAPHDNAPMQFWRAVGPRLIRSHLAAGHRAAIVDPVRWPEDAWWPAFDRLLEADGTGPLTFLHGDVHAGNVYYVDSAPGGLLDWQLALRGSWALDVTYLLTTALTTEDRVAHEVALLRGYLDRLRSRGVDVPGWDEAWLRYRQNALYGILMWLITPDGVHAEAAQACFLRRCLAAGEHLDTLDALNGG